MATSKIQPTTNPKTQVGNALTATGQSVNLPSNFNRVYVRVDINGSVVSDYIEIISNSANAANTFVWGYSTWSACFEVQRVNGTVTWKSETKLTGSKAGTWNTTIRVYVD